MNRTKFLITLFAITFSFLASGRSYVTPMLLEEAKLEIDDKYTIAANTNGSDESNDEPVIFKANVSTAGTLAEVIGDKLLDIDGIEVVGPINDADFYTLWKSTFYGNVYSINLEKAIIYNGVIPAFAFYHYDEQADYETPIIKSNNLKEIILPEGVTKIGQAAFRHNRFLDYVKLPSTLKKIGDSAFSSCDLSSEHFTLPESLEYIEALAFSGCKFYNGELNLPKRLRSIAYGAFGYTNLSEINFPESLEYIGKMAFTECNLKSVSLPKDCVLDWEEGYQFEINRELREANLPYNLTIIPKGIFYGCHSLEVVDMPQNVETIGEEAFYNCYGITNIIFPESLKQIQSLAFHSCLNLESIVLPSSLSDIVGNPFTACFGLKSIYSKATTPPESYIVKESGKVSTDPFPEADKSIPLYVPIGTKEAYMAAPGWNTFKNIIETDNFPAAGVDNVVIDIKTEDGSTYDLNGRKVNNLTPGEIYIRNGRKFISTSENNL